MLRPANEKFQVGCFYGSISPTGRWYGGGNPRISRDLEPWTKHLCFFFFLRPRWLCFFALALEALRYFATELARYLQATRRIAKRRCSRVLGFFFFFFGYYCLFVSNKGSYTILKLAADLRKLKRNKKLHTGNTSYCACIIINIIIVINFYYYYNDYF